MGSDTGLLPTPSPELGYSLPHVASASRYGQLHPGRAHHPHHNLHNTSAQSSEIFLQQHPSWDDYGSAAGTKRSHDSASVEDFFIDMKKRRVAPNYDSRE